MQINKRSFFDTSEVSKEYYNEYLNKGFVTNEDYFTEKIFYIIIFIIFNIFAIGSLIFFFKLRQSYIIHQRNFALTFAGGIVLFLNIFISFIPQIFEVPCFLSVFSANFINPLVNFIFYSRSLRIILFYRFNIFKVSSIKNKRVRANLNGVYNSKFEPNYYLPKITRRINRIIELIILVPTLISILATVLIYILGDNMVQKCPFLELKDAMISLKTNQGRELFVVVQIYGFIYTVLSIINSILLLFIKDASKYGAKFECLSVSILITISNIINIILQINASSRVDLYRENEIEKTPRKIFLNLFEITKGGKMLFTIVSIYMLFASITLPVIQYYKAKSFSREIFNDPMSSIQYFYKVLNSNSLIAELRDIAVQEFSVENVLFWENYQILQKMVYRYQLEYKKAKEMGDERIVSQYDFESYYQQQLQSFSSSSMEDYSYDPNMEVPKEILPYYTSFYHMFIDFNGIAVVNISGDTVKRIINNLCSYPTVGMYDDAKNEVVEVMFSSIYPILLRKNKIINTSL
ncbi:hypothetical protein H8356DRAFT_1031158 [Neocallimastix lanati (nom. inval.)]|uniref:RGS domain-containing protein n=1 Tax=Neocallimastix californiae TaxID=1754190 RepID=A0A1Y2AZR7_9FUNG|nr:hypothetical protein H8356DRAFT_1031158 [Neocallimastix sp. JGI-2020a]ORY27976.1 hypothetical protein LY90DRAFT_674247 [Neocallimastix californiae]|eukprot:ORY27976.1 hypothetical protein LY90DRAFT_674247 [Neocallimastix californiae]